MVQCSGRTITAANTAGLVNILVPRTQLCQSCSSTNLIFYLSAFFISGCLLIGLIGIGHKIWLNCYLLISYKALGHSSSNFQQIQSLPFVSINNNVTTLSKKKHTNACCVNTRWEFKGVKTSRDVKPLKKSLQQTVPVANVLYIYVAFWPGYTCLFSVAHHVKEKLDHSLKKKRKFLFWSTRFEFNPLCQPVSHFFWRLKIRV